ncbi:transposase [Streptomyces sp. NBC_01320]|uniref:transposase n=1 Tax=Streptomyces sp. NBC_01320 TaxID=2903824 RepID=UPI003FA38A40
MGTSKYSPEFRADAVALYRSGPGRTYASVAKNLGVKTTRRSARGRGIPSRLPCPARWRPARWRGRTSGCGAQVKELELEREPAKAGREVFCGRDQLVRNRQLTTA